MVTIDKLKINPNKKVIDDIKIQIIYIPLKSKLGYTFNPLVEVGTYVTIGTPLGKNDVCDLLLTSSVSGTVVGLTKKEAASKLKNFTVEYSGSGDKVINQSPEAGSRIPEYSSIRLYLG